MVKQSGLGCSKPCASCKIKFKIKIHYVKIVMKLSEVAYMIYSDLKNIILIKICVEK